MAKTEKSSLETVSALVDKALRRGEKLERTLTKLIAQLEPGSAVEDLLKALQGGLKGIRKSTQPSTSKKAVASTKAPKEKAAKSPKKPAKTKATARKPAPADISPLPETVGES